MEDVDYVAELERAGGTKLLLELALSMGGTAVGAGALAAALGAGPLALPAALVGFWSAGVTGMLLNKLSLGLHARRRVLRRGAASARVVQALGDAVDGELVRVTGKLRVCAPILDPATEQPVGAYARWATRAASCQCWGACEHGYGPKDAVSLAFEGRNGELELHLDSGIVRVAEGWADTFARAPLSAKGHGGELLREGDTVALVGRARAESRGAARGYRGAGTCIDLVPGIAGLVLFERVSEV